MTRFQAFLIVILTVLAIFIFLASTVFIMHYLPQDLSLGERAGIFYPISVSISLIFLIFSLHLLPYKNFTSIFALHKISQRQFIYWLFVLLVIYLVISLINYLLPQWQLLQWENQLFTNNNRLVLLLLVIIFLAPIYEELIFRGVLYFAFSQLQIPTSGIIILTSLLWTLLHMQYSWILQVLVFCIGFIFAIARWQTNSLFTSIFMHVAFNGLQVCNYFLVNN